MYRSNVASRHSSPPGFLPIVMGLCFHADSRPAAEEKRVLRAGAYAATGTDEARLVDDKATNDDNGISILKDQHD